MKREFNVGHKMKCRNENLDKNAYSIWLLKLTITRLTRDNDDYGSQYPTLSAATEKRRKAALSYQIQYWLMKATVTSLRYTKDYDNTFICICWWYGNANFCQCLIKWLLLHMFFLNSYWCTKELGNKLQQSALYSEILWWY
jgi:hypothetical protein